jgi:hypothetical protein
VGTARGVWAGSGGRCASRGDVGQGSGLPGSLKGRERAGVSSLGLFGTGTGQCPEWPEGTSVVWPVLAVWSWLCGAMCRGRIPCWMRGVVPG